jgi:hypothetical protein
MSLLISYSRSRRQLVASKLILAATAATRIRKSNRKDRQALNQGTQRSSKRPPPMSKCAAALTRLMGNKSWSIAQATSFS